jgi:hypothetical protein
MIMGKEAQARLGHWVWLRRQLSPTAAQQALRYYATQGISAAVVYLFNPSGALSMDQGAQAIRCTIGAYADAVSTIRQADVPSVLCYPIGPGEYAIESQVKEWTRFFERRQALNNGG